MMKRVHMVLFGLLLLLPALACNFSAGRTTVVTPPPVNLALPTSVAALGTVSPPPVVVTVMETAVSPTPTPTPTLPPTPCSLRTDWPLYTVLTGDTLFRIAQRADTTVNDLVAANCLPDRNRLSVGQTLHVPQPIIPTPPQPTVVSEWSNPVVYPVSECYQGPFRHDAGVVVGAQWRVRDGLEVLPLHEEAVANKPAAALGTQTPFKVTDGPVCFTADFGSSTLVFRRWQVTTLDGDLSGWIDEVDPFTNERNINSDPQVIEFTASPQRVQSGETVTLTWEVEGTTQINIRAHHRLLRFGNALISDGLLPASGSLTVTTPTTLKEVSYSILGAEADTVLVTVEIECTYEFFVETEVSLFACPQGEVTLFDAVYQPFAGGFMVWQEDTIWVMASDPLSGVSFADTWDGEAVTYGEEPPDGRFLPQRGFGKVWVENEWVRNELGWALQPEEAYQMEMQQTQTAYISYVYFFSLPDGRLVEVHKQNGIISLGWDFTTRR